MKKSMFRIILTIAILFVITAQSCVNNTSANKQQSKQEFLLKGPYKLHKVTNSVVETNTYVIMHLTPFDDNTFIVRGEDWVGKGSISGDTGSYKWKFDDGKSGNTTFTINRDGSFDGHVNGYDDKSNWDFKAWK